MINIQTHLKIFINSHIDEENLFTQIILELSSLSHFSLFCLSAHRINLEREKEMISLLDLCRLLLFGVGRGQTENNRDSFIPKLVSRLNHDPHIQGNVDFQNLPVVIYKQ